MTRDLFSPMTTTAGGKRLLLSMSGGKTSAYMTRQVLTRFAHLWEEIAVVFANTGQENEQTLEFVRNCDKHFGFNTVWVESVTNHGERKSSSHKVVTFNTASRNGEPFEDMIRKYGIPNVKHPHCTRELKKRTIESYARSIGWRTDYVVAIGIRPDEMRRVNPKAVEQKIVYPLIDWFYSDKQDVNDWWEEQAFNLELEEHQGNCKWCWKKSFAKHARLLQESPEIYEFPARMEAEYGYVGPENEPADAFPRVFFRENRSTLVLRDYCRELSAPKRLIRQDDNGGCGESCEMFPMIDSDTLPLFGEAA